MGPAWFNVAVCVTLAAMSLGLLLGGPRIRRLLRGARRRVPITVVRRDLLEPTGRPIEVVAHDLHRLARGYHRAPDRVTFARYEARRRAYDRVLAEACRALEVDHLLLVLPPGDELDGERQRVEAVLEHAGLVLVPDLGQA